MDLKGCEAGETTVPIDPIQDPQNYHKWGDCIQNETLSGTFYAPCLVPELQDPIYTRTEFELFF